MLCYKLIVLTCFTFSLAGQMATVKSILEDKMKGKLNQIH